MTVSWAGLSPERAVLANGVTVIVKETRVTPAVTIHAAVHAGSANDPPDLPGLSYFLSRTIDRGSASMTADEIANTLESRGVSMAASVNRHALSLVATCLVEDFESVLGIMADCLRHPVFPDQEVTTRRGEMITFIRQDEDNPAAVAMAGLMETLYGAQHPYGRRIRGTVAGAERMTRSDLVSFHRRFVVPSSLVIVIVGDIDANAAVEACANAFEGWGAVRSQSDELPAPVPSQTRRVRVIPMMN